MSETSNYIKNFPFQTFRLHQEDVLRQTEEAFKSYKYVICECPTGFGKSPVAITTCRTLGTSYICTSTKDLQAQYSRDFPFLKIAKGKNNFICAVKQDFIRNGTYKCTLCPIPPSPSTSVIKSKLEGCQHQSADYGPCVDNPLFKYDAQSGHRGCKYKTLLEDYEVTNKGTIEEEVFIDKSAIDNYYQEEFSEWSYPETSGLKEESRMWRPCEYYHQLNTALAASHSIFNYSMFLIYTIMATRQRLPPRQLLVLDEAHRIEEEVVKFAAISISKWKLRKYIPEFDFLPDYGFDDIEKWIEFLTTVEGKISSSVQLHKINAELEGEAEIFRRKLDWVIERKTIDTKGWIISEIKKEWVGRNREEVVRIELKPLDIAPYCRSIFELCEKTLMMSATKDAFCASIGLVPEEVKFIQVGSDFPLKNRPIYPLKIAYLNYTELQRDAVKQLLAKVVDKIMTFHKDHKGIIHTTSYEQLNFIKQNISESNRRRLLETNPDVERNEIIEEHINATRPTVLISPSLHLGLDLADNLSRFQVITKVPYPSLGDRWINEKRKRSERWYAWKTGLQLIQATGRSVRSKDDWATTYVLDSKFGDFINENKEIIPTWFLESIKW